ncbi:YkoF family thiamine/hydroxymethylpyrimidine-binding protein [uncultured Cellulomonas sp.]|uniref:YkoF family thiamine/hydroxymethylpyrimidine-binding protein n=1 Tax=uncultured Cellulomonas sp. TaxID=189682 RepID=UPI0028E9BBA2|nr:YkoF family thiamine/hydroxymethylpyrimidine-binding protein [uncultured Cellulomonas sp.]
MSTQTDPQTLARATALGIGARISLHPHCDDYVEVITSALAAADPSRVEVRTDDVSTLLRGTEHDVLRFVHEVLAAAGETRWHVVAHVQLSRGCPGEVSCELPDDALLEAVDVPELLPTGLPASAHWALYPLDDTGGDHLAHIMNAVAAAGARATTTPEHFVTRLDGDLADVLTAVATGWLEAARYVRHVVAHVTVSMHSPSAGAR